MAKVSIWSGLVLSKTVLEYFMFTKQHWTCLTCQLMTGMKGMANDAGVYCSV